MSSTRRAKDNSVFHQSKFASSPEFERGLMGNLVAKRCALLDVAADRELIWFIQYLSHQPGGLTAISNDLIKKYGHQLQTSAMAEIGVKRGKICNADQVRKIRKELPSVEAASFPLYRDDFGHDQGMGMLLAISETIDAEYEDQNYKFPKTYLADKFIELCSAAARENLENYLRELCLDPAASLNYGPWYFTNLISTFREYKKDFIEQKSIDFAITALGKKVCEVLDYTAYSRGLTLMQGEARLGKSFAARQWCVQHSGSARFIEVPPSNDDATFFRALARGLGLGNFSNYKVAEIRERVESVLLTGDLLLVLDEAHRLWPQRNLRYGFPGRINWLMAMANKNVPICCISTPQFIQWQKAAEEKGQWNSAQLTGRIGHYESLPTELSPEDLMAVAKSILPEANSNVLRALAVYARSSARYLAAIDSISKRARYIALRDGRDMASTEDVRKAMQESVIPADTKLQCALASVKKGKREKIQPTAPTVESSGLSEEILPAHERGNLNVPGYRIRDQSEASLIEA